MYVGDAQDQSKIKYTQQARTVRAALTSWPATWTGSSMNVVVPSAGKDAALMLLGALGVVLAVWVSVRLRQWRELALLAAPGLLLVTALGMTIFDRSAGISMMELAWMIGSPILVLVIIRAVGQLRADGRDSAVRKYAFAGPLLIACLLVLFSAAASVTLTNSNAKFLSIKHLPHSY